MLQVNENAPVFTARDEHVGKVDRIVVDPLTRTVTHIVVRKGIFFPEDKVIAIDDIVTATEERINLSTQVDAESFPPFVDHHYVTLDEHIQAEGISSHATSLPAIWYGPLGIMTPVYESAMRTITERNIPERAAALEPGTAVLARGRRDLGRLEEIITTNNGTVTHIVVAEAGLHRTRRALPVNWIESISEAEILLGTTENMVKSIKAFDPSGLTN